MNGPRRHAIRPVVDGRRLEERVVMAQVTTAQVLAWVPVVTSGAVHRTNAQIQAA